MPDAEIAQVFHGALPERAHYAMTSGCQRNIVRNGDLLLSYRKGIENEASRAHAIIRSCHEPGLMASCIQGNRVACIDNGFEDRWRR